MFNIKERVKFHNRYDVQVINSTTGKVIQEAHAENVVLDGVWNILMNDSSSYYNQRALYTLALGTGSGEPSSADTGVFQAGVTLSLSSSNTTRTSMYESFPTSTYVFRINVPATADYVGEYTEIAIAGRRQRASSTYDTVYWSHAMFEDAEGNPIVITKTDLDVLVVTFTVYVTLGSSDDNFMWVHPRLNVINNLFRNGTSTVYAPFSNFSIYSTSNGGCNRLLLCTCLVNDGQTITTWEGIPMGNEGYSVDITERTYTCPSVRLGTTEGNGSYYHGLILATVSGNNASVSSNSLGLGGVVFPNTSVFPNRPITGAAVGVGDDATTLFNTPIPYFIEGTDTIYLDGVPLTRSVDYTLPSSNNYNGLTCLQPYRHMRIISNGAPGGSLANLIGNYTSRYVHIPFHPTANVTMSPNEMFNTSGPMVFELLDSAPVNRFNIFRFTLTQHEENGGLVFYKTAQNSSWYSIPYSNSAQNNGTLSILDGCMLVFETSMDNSTWYPAVSVDLSRYTVYTWSGSTGFVPYYYMYAIGPFEPVQFKYLRVTFDRTNATNSTVANAYAVALHTHISTANDKTYGDYGMYLNMYDMEPPLKFVNPPAAGAVITMDATLNRPFKTNQHVIDMAMTLQL